MVRLLKVCVCLAKNEVIDGILLLGLPLLVSNALIYERKKVRNSIEHMKCIHKTISGGIQHIVQSLQVTNIHMYTHSMMVENIHVIPNNIKKLTYHHHGHPCHYHVVSWPTW